MSKLEKDITYKYLETYTNKSVPNEIHFENLYLNTLNDTEEYSQSFVKLIEKAIDHIAQDFSRTPKERQNRSEDALTVDVVSSLVCLGFNASHDTYIGGHCDIVIKGNYNFLWLAEAKIYRSSYWLMQGFKQLVTRYMTANKNQDSGGLIIYCYKPQSNCKIKNWASYLKRKNNGLWKYIDIKINKNDKSYIHSEHTHNKTGNKCRIYHKIFPLFLIKKTNNYLISL